MHESKRPSVQETPQYQTVPPNGLLDDMAIALLRLHPKTRNYNRFIITIRGRYSKLTRAILISKTIIPYIPSVRLNNWIIRCSISNKSFSENGSKIVAEFWKTVCHILSI